MSMINEQIKEINNCIACIEECFPDDRVAIVLKNAADTIEVLSAKLAAANMERTSAYYNGGWIPCSERLPEESGHYMVCIYNKETVDFDFRKTWFAHTDDYYIQESEWRELYCDEKVTAWRPPPEPYKEDCENG